MPLLTGRDPLPEVLGENLVVLAALLDVGETGVEHLHELGVLALHDGKGVRRGELLGLLGHDAHAVALAHAVGHDRVVLEAGDGVAGEDILVHHVRVREVGDGELVLLGDGLGPSEALRAVLAGHGGAAQPLEVLDVGVLGHGGADVGVVVGVGEVVVLLALGRDGHAGDHGVGLVGLERGNGSVEAQRVELVGEALIGGNGGEKIEVDAHEVAVLVGELERREGGVGGNDVALAISLVAGLIVGASAQRTRLCMVGGIRDMILFHENKLLLGFIAILISALICNLILTLTTNAAYFNLGFTAQPIAHTDGLWNFLGMFLAGFGCVLLGGCPLRQLVLSGEGNTDSAITVIGLIIGAAFAHNFSLASSGEGPTDNGKIAVIIGIAVVTTIAWINTVQAKKQ